MREVSRNYPLNAVDMALKTPVYLTKKMLEDSCTLSQQQRELAAWAGWPNGTGYDNSTPNAQSLRNYIYCSTITTPTAPRRTTAYEPAPELEAAPVEIGAAEPEVELEPDLGEIGDPVAAEPVPEPAPTPEPALPVANPDATRAVVMLQHCQSRMRSRSV